MVRYIVKRLFQGIPLLLVISITLFLLMMNIGDPIATMGGRTITRPEDRERLTRQLGLDKPIAVQYFYLRKLAINLVAPLPETRRKIIFDHQAIKQHY